MTTVFYAPPEAVRDGRVVLPSDEARHAAKVLRHRVGDVIEVVDGEGGRFEVRLDEVGREVSGEVIGERRDVGESAVELSVGLGVLKSAARFETFVEKAVELGVARIIPLITERTEQVRLKRTRLESIMVAAIKQCGRSRLPDLSEPTALPEVLRSPAADVRLLCHEGIGAGTGIASVLTGRADGSTSILVGPEGGFSDAEVASAAAAGWTIVSLGPRRLRAETAAVVAAAAVMMARGG